LTGRAATALALLSTLASTAALAGCGLGAGRGTTDVSLTVTRDFGRGAVATRTARRAPGSETVMRMLERFLPVRLRYGGGFVEAIDGLAGGPPHQDWFYYVNGVQAPIGAASTAVHRGDRIWWDLHDWSATQSVPAVVGSFPEPFVHGVGGKRLPTTIECASDVDAACRRVSSELRAAGVPVASQLLGTGSGPDTLGVVVGTWKELRPEVAASLIAHGPSASGVYARFASGGSALELLGPNAQVQRTLGAGAGLVAATADSSSEPTWIVSGTDAAGVNAAAGSLNQRALHDHFALAVQGSTQMPLPLESAR
jgi:Domain of unknown function (DUF4430)